MFWLLRIVAFAGQYLKNSQHFFSLICFPFKIIFCMNVYIKMAFSSVLEGVMVLFNFFMLSLIIIPLYLH